MFITTFKSLYLEQTVIIAIRQAKIYVAYGYILDLATR